MQQSELPPIDSFWGDYRFLSNFYAAPFVCHWLAWDTAEHAYQWSKCLDVYGNIVHRELADAIRDAKTPGEAKHIGQAECLNTPAWRARRLFVMQPIVRAKFNSKPMRDLLLSTYPRMLIEGNNHGDRYWGTVNGKGQNHLGRILMEIRADFMKGSIFDLV